MHTNAAPYYPCDAYFPYVGYRALGVLGLVIAGLFAAAMSTLSASMNSSATAFLTDIYPKLKRPSQASFPAPEDGKRMLRLARPVTLVLEVLGGLGGLFLLRMTTKRANSSGAA